MRELCTSPSVLLKRKNFSAVAKRGLFLFIGIVVIPLILFASHFRYGTISWENTSGNTVVFKISQAWRWSFFGNPSIGSTVQTDRFYFGDGTSQSVILTVTSVNSSEDWFYGTATITKTYAAPGNYNAYYGADCCRVSSLQNNADGYWRGETTVNVGSGNRSPVTSILPLVNVPVNNSAAIINIPAVDPDGASLTYRLATSSEAASPGTFVQPNGLTVNPSTGQLTFNTVGKTVGQLYSTQIIVSDGTTKIPIDFIMRISSVVVNNNPPSFDYTVTPPDGNIITVATGQSAAFNVKALDNDASSTLYLSVAGVPVGATFTPPLPLNVNPSTTQFTWTPTSSDVGTYVMNFNAVDNYGATASTSVTINVIANSISTGALSQSLLCPGATISVPYTATGVYNTGNIFTAQLSDGTGSFATPTNIGSVTATSSGTISATVPSNVAVGAGYRIRVVSSNPVVTGGNNGSNLTVEAAPIVSSLAPTTVEPIPIGTTVTVNATYSGNNLNVASINWGDGITDNISTTNTHTYSSPGVYTVTATLTNTCNQTASKEYQYIVAYDPTAGFITGGGWINSPSGAYAGDPALKGKANFGFVSKYQKGQTKPSGNTQFEFHTAALDFKSTSYEWLVISGTTRGQFKGEGTINGSGNYGFLVSAVDGNGTGGDGIDKFRIKIWNKDITTSDNIVYDNQMGDADDAVAATPIEGGSIVIHVPTKGKTTTVAVGVNDAVESIYDGKLAINALPNPSNGLFTLKAQSGSTQSMQVRIMDVLGRIIETRRNISANTTLTFGNSYRPGVYYVEVVQGTEKRMLKLVKQ